MSRFVVVLPLWQQRITLAARAFASSSSSSQTEHVDSERRRCSSAVSTSSSSPFVGATIDGALVIEEDVWEEKLRVCVAEREMSLGRIDKCVAIREPGPRWCGNCSSPKRRAAFSPQAVHLYRPRTVNLKRLLNAEKVKSGQQKVFELLLCPDETASGFVTGGICVSASCFQRGKRFPS